MSQAPQKPFYFAEERQRKIVEILREQGKIIVPSLCEYFNVSPATIRNDLHELEESGLLKRTHGGAILNTQVTFEPNSMQKEVKNVAAKRAIAAAALDLINDGDAIAIDTGTTTAELVRLLSSKNHLTIVVNDIQLATLLENSVNGNIVVIGGLLKKGFHCMVGPMAISNMRDLRVDKAFIATNGLTLNGLSTPDMYQAESKKAMIHIANHVIVLADSSKFGVSSFISYAALNDIEQLITDSCADANMVRDLRDRGIAVTLASIQEEES